MKKFKYVITQNQSETIFYTVSFDTQGGTSISNILVAADSKISKPETTKEGYYVSAWLYNGNSWSFENDIVTENITLVAQWELVLPGEAVYTTAGTYSWVAPEGVTSVSAVVIGGGGSGAFTNNQNASGGGGGALAWKNNITVNPGQSYTVVVGAGGSSGTITDGQDSYFITTNTVFAQGGKKGNLSPNSNDAALGSGNSTYIGDGGGQGKSSSNTASGQGLGVYSHTGGAGAGGYNGVSNASQDGLNGGGANGSFGSSSSPIFGLSGGGTGIYGQGTSGVFSSTFDGQSGSGGNTTDINSNPRTSSWGGGGRPMVGYTTGNQGRNGAVRILWGEGRAFPSTNVGLTT
jgi:hypothetical protein